MYGLMEESMLENGSTIKCMGRVNMNGRMVECTKDNTSMIRRILVKLSLDVLKWLVKSLDKCLPYLFCALYMVQKN